jgi:hypothetical protein
LSLSGRHRTASCHPGSAGVTKVCPRHPTDRAARPRPSEDRSQSTDVPSRSNLTTAGSRPTRLPPQTSPTGSTSASTHPHSGPDGPDRLVSSHHGLLTAPRSTGMPILAPSADRHAMSEFGLLERAVSRYRRFRQVPVLAHLAVRDAMAGSRVRYHSLDRRRGHRRSAVTPGGGYLLERCNVHHGVCDAWRNSDTRRARSAVCDEGDDGIGGVTVVVLTAAVVDGGGAGIGVASGDLHVAQGDPGVQRGHDERRPQHV